MRRARRLLLIAACAAAVWVAVPDAARRLVETKPPDLGVPPSRPGEGDEEPARIYESKRKDDPLGLRLRSETRHETDDESYRGRAAYRAHAKNDDARSADPEPEAHTRRGELFVLAPERREHAPGFVTTAVVGFDSGAPRELWLWRVDRERAVKLAHTESGASGWFSFPQLPVPFAALELVVAPASASPNGREASLPFRLGRGETPPSPPRAAYGPRGPSDSRPLR